jgi:hypothetical protein
VTAQHPAPTEERLLTPGLELAPVVADDAEELTEVFADERLYVFLGSHPITTEELRAQFDRLAGARGAIRSQAGQRALPRSAATAALTSLHTHDGIVDVPQGTLPPADVLDRIDSDQALITRFNG